MGDNNNPAWPQGNEEPLLRLSVADNNNNNNNNHHLDHHHDDDQDNSHNLDNYDHDYLSASSLRINDSSLRASTATTVITMDQTRASGGGGGEAPDEERQAGTAAAGETAAEGRAEAGERGIENGTEQHDESNTSLLPPPLPDHDDSSLQLYSSEDGDNHERGANQTLIEEKEMQHKLLDMESSFLPEQPSTVDIERTGADDTFLLGVPSTNHPQEQPEASRPAADVQSQDYTQPSLNSRQDGGSASATDNERAPQTPRQDAAGEQQMMGSTTPTEEYHQEQPGEHVKSSSPAAEAASRDNGNRRSHTDEERMGGDQTNNTTQEGETADESRILGSVNRPEGTDAD